MERQTDMQTLRNIYFFQKVHDCDDLEFLRRCIELKSETFKEI